MNDEFEFQAEWDRATQNAVDDERYEAAVKLETMSTPQVRWIASTDRACTGASKAEVEAARMELVKRGASR